MMLFKETEVEKGCDEFMFEGQDILQKVFIVVALLCIPMLLFGKPIYILLTKRTGKHVVSIFVIGYLHKF